MLVRVVYQGNKLTEITGKQTEEIIVSVGYDFLHLLLEIFLAYPEIEARIPPGTLGILLNDKPPTDFDVIHDGDVVTLIGGDLLVH